MNILDFKKKLDNREFWGNTSKEVWIAAYKWVEETNEKSNNTCDWSWDCGLKLDYDGDICQISSRFYPPHKSHEDYGKYHGTITVVVLDESIYEKEIEAKTLDELKDKVEKYVADLEFKIKTNIKAIFPKEKLITINK